MRIETILLSGALLAVASACGGAPTIATGLPASGDGLSLLRTGGPAVGCIPYDHTGGPTVGFRCESQDADVVAFPFQGQIVVECDGIGRRECDALIHSMAQAGAAGPSVGN